MGDKKNDMDRIGLFQEMGYVTIGDKYKSANRMAFNDASQKGKQMLPGGSKERSALQAGYFTDKFGRVFESEGYSDPIKLRRQHRLREAQKNIVKSAFLPSSGEKKMSGLGSHYGTLSGPIGALSPQAKPGKPHKTSGKNFMTNPGKRGTGFGYLGVTLGNYPKYQNDPYEVHKDITKKELAAHKAALKGDSFKLNMHPKSYFDSNPYHTDKPMSRKGSASITKKLDGPKFKPSSPGKRPAGCKAGTFDPYPSHSADPYKMKIHRPVNVVNKSGKIFVPSQGPKNYTFCFYSGSKCYENNQHTELQISIFNSISCIATTLII